MSRRVIVTGGRLYGEQYDREGHERPLWMLEVEHIVGTLNVLVWTYLDDILIVQGGATGADRIAREWSKARGPEPVTFRADWDRFGRRAGRLRNEVMVAAGADFVVAFPGGRGTNHCVETARLAKLMVLDLRDEGPMLAA